MGIKITISCPRGVVLEPDLSLITDGKSRILISGENVHVTSGLTWIKTSEQLSLDPYLPVPIKQSHEFSPSTGAM